MKPYFLFAIVLLIFPFSLCAQFKIQDISVLPGFVVMGSTDGTLADFKALAPQSVLLNNDFNDYQETGNYSTSVSGAFSVLLGFRFNEKQRSALRLGVSYNGGRALELKYYKQSIGPFDTLVSQQTGLGFTLDSINTKDYTMEYTIEQIRFDASYIYNILPKSRVSLFAGIGFTAGYAINAKTLIEYQEHTMQHYSLSSTPVYNITNAPNNYINKKEKFRNKNNFVFSAYIPMGIDFRLGNKREFFRRIHFLYEARPGINIHPIAESRTISSACMQNGFGIRVMLN